MTKPRLYICNSAESSVFPLESPGQLPQQWSSLHFRPKAERFWVYHSLSCLWFFLLAPSGSRRYLANASVAVQPGSPLAVFVIYALVPPMGLLISEIQLETGTEN